MLTLTATNISKQYGGRTVLSDFNIDVKQGEVVALLGPNGAGKTTSFYIIAGIIVSSTGTISFNGVDITNFPLHVRAKVGIGYLPQEASIFRKMTVEENILIALESKYEIIDKKAKEEMNKTLEKLLTEFNIQHIRKSLGAVLSGGERRRAEIARILAIDPIFLLLDEPFAGVDPVAVGDIKNMILALKRRNIGIIITDHNVRETLEIVDRSYILYDGRVICHGTTDTIINNKMVREIYLGRDFEIKATK